MKLARDSQNNWKCNKTYANIMDGTRNCQKKQNKNKTKENKKERQTERVLRLCGCVIQNGRGTGYNTPWLLSCSGVN